MERLPTAVPLVLYAILAYAHLLPKHARILEPHLRTIGLIGVLFHGVALGFVLAATRATPGFPEALSAASLGIVAAWLWTSTKSMRALGVFLLPLGVVILGTALVVPHERVAALAAAGPSPWLPVHLGLMFSGLAGFAVSFVVGVVYLVVRQRLKNRRFDGLASLPPLERLDRLQFRATLFGFVFLTLGIAAGGAWAAAALTDPWVFDPKVGFTLGLWAWYGIALNLRLFGGMRGRWSALFGIIGFVGVLFSMIAMNFLLPGWHGYE